MAGKYSKEEISSLSSALNDILGNSEKLDKNLEKIFMGTGKITRQLEKDLKKAAVGQLKNVSKLSKEIEDLRKNWANLSDEQKKELSIKEQQIKESASLASAVGQITEAQDKQKKGTISLGKEVDGLMTKLSRYTSALGILGASIDAIVSLYRNWAELQVKVTEGMGNASRALGGTERQLSAFRSSVENFRGTFSQLQGDVDGYAESFQFVQEVTLALRRDVSSFSDEIREGMLQAGIGFNIGADGAANLFRILETGVAGAETSIQDFGARTIRFAESLGANASQLISDFLEAKDSVAEFGAAGEQTFRRAAMMANEFGFEARRVFDMMKGFDTFGQASQNVNQLNAMLGTSLSSFELMMEQEPTARLERIRQELFAQGQTWNTMSRQAKQALAQITGQDMSILSRVFGEGRSLREIEAEQERAARTAEARENQRISNQEMMNQLLQRASIIFDTWDRNIRRIWNTLSKAFSPIFEIIHENVLSIARQFNDWVQNSEDGQRFIRNISNWIKEVIDDLKQVNWADLWEDTKRTWEDWKPAVETIGRVLMEVLGFVRDNPELFAVLFAASVVTRFAGGLGSIASLISPTGAIVAGAAILAMHFANAARNLENMQNFSEEVRRNQDRGLATPEETEELQEIQRHSRVGMQLAADDGVVANTLKSFAGNGLTQTAMEFTGTSAESLGNFLGINPLEWLGRDMQRSAAAARAAHEGDFKGLARTSIASGASSREVLAQLQTVMRQNPEAELSIRRSFGIAANQDLSDGLMTQLQQMESTSAARTAPATSRTVNAPTTSSAPSAPRSERQQINLYIDQQRLKSIEVEGARR